MEKSEILLFSNGIIIKLVRSSAPIDEANSSNIVADLSNDKAEPSEVNIRLRLIEVHKLKNNSNMPEDFSKYITKSENLIIDLIHKS